MVIYKMTGNVKFHSILLIGLMLAAFGSSGILLIFSHFEPKILSDGFVLVRELSLFLILIPIFVIVDRCEENGLSSIGLHSRNWVQSVKWIFILLVSIFFLLSIIILIFNFLGLSLPQGENKYNDVSIWVLILMMLRAGIIEEICYRGFIQGQLEKLSSHLAVFLLVPTIIFALLHYRQGLPGIIIAFVLGMVMALFYWRKKDLKVNIITHFLVDFIPNILFPYALGE